MKCRTAIVTGAGRGIGKATALALAGEGIHVAVTARSETELRAVAEEVEKSGGKASAFPFDLTKTEEIPGLVAQVHEGLGSIDLLVNNAGVFVEVPISELDAGVWDHALRVNLTAPFLLCREVLPWMKEQGGGRIINIGSTSSVQGYLNQSAYCASKHGLLGFGRVLAIEAKPLNVHVHTLCPGGVDTDLIKGTYLASRLEGQPMIQPDDIAAQVLFLVRQPDHVDISEMVTRRFMP